MLPGKFSFFALFIVCSSIVHINFEYNFWLTQERDIFGKYEAAGQSTDKIEIAKDVYFTKATWMIALVWMMCPGMSLRAAIAYSFMLYSVELMLLFPLRTYTFPNLALAAGLLVEQLVERFKPPAVDNPGPAP